MGGGARLVLVTSALAEEGLDVEEADLERLPFDVEVDEQLRNSLPP